MTSPTANGLPRRYLFRVGRWRAPSYTVLLYLGCVAGVYAGAAVADARGLRVGRVTVASVALIVPALVGSRLLFVAQHAAVYRADPSRIWRRGEGGAALFGGLVLALVVSLPLLSALDLPFVVFWDCGAVTMAVGNVFTRIGCHLNGCCAGRPTAGRLGARLPGRTGTHVRRIPVQLIESAWVALSVVVAIVVGRHVDGDGDGDGAIFAVVIALYGVGRAVLERLREPDPARAASTINLWVAGGLFVAGTAMLAAIAG